MRDLKITLRQILNRMAYKERYTIFSKAVDPEEVEDYYDIINHQMNLTSTMSWVVTTLYHCILYIL